MNEPLHSPHPYTARGTFPSSLPTFLDLSYWTVSSLPRNPGKRNGVTDSGRHKRRRG